MEYLEDYFDVISSIPGEITTILKDISSLDKVSRDDLDQELTSFKANPCLETTLSLQSRLSNNLKIQNEKRLLMDTICQKVEKISARVEDDLKRVNDELNKRKNQTEEEDEEPVKKKIERKKKQEKKRKALAKEDEEEPEDVFETPVEEQVIPSKRARRVKNADSPAPPPPKALSSPIGPVSDHADPDEPVYCYCKQVSFGEMIACDNAECEIEWFHFGCVGLTAMPAGKWLCQFCTPKSQ